MDIDTQEIDGVIFDYVIGGTSFTSLDITNTLKGKGTRIRNRTVAEYLRNNFTRVAHGIGVPYNSTLINVDSRADGFTQAYLYHHYTKDADDYMDRDQNPQSFKTRPNDVQRTIGTFVDLQRVHDTLQQAAINEHIAVVADAQQPTTASAAAFLDKTRDRVNKVKAAAKQRTQPTKKTANDNWKTQERDAWGRFC